VKIPLTVALALRISGPSADRLSVRQLCQRTLATGSHLSYMCLSQGQCADPQWPERLARPGADLARQVNTARPFNAVLSDRLCKKLRRLSIAGRASPAREFSSAPTAYSCVCCGVWCLVLRTAHTVRW
jgi:hypothetical protein